MTALLRWTADLLLVLAVAALAGAAVLFDQIPSAIRILFGIPLLLFVPGYALVSALYPESGSADPDHLGPVERFALSVAASLALVPGVALAVHLTPYPITTVPVLSGLLGVTVLCTFLALVRRARVDPDSRFRIDVSRLGVLPTLFETRRSTLGPPRTPLQPMTDRQRTLNVVLAISVLALAASGAYAIAMGPPAGEPYSELYVLGETDDGELAAGEFPREFTVGESQSVFVGVGNEHETDQSYTVVVVLEQLDGPNNEDEVLEREELDRFTVEVGAGETEIVEHGLEPTIAGENLRVSYLLYEGDAPSDATEEDAEAVTRIWISATG